MYATALESMGDKVTVASNGDEGLELINQNPFDLILLDVSMPILDGFGFLEAFDRKKHANVKIIMLTNSSDIPLVNRSIELGANNYIDKANFTPAAMKQLVDSVLGSPTA